MSAPTLIVQTTYAELLERCSAASFEETFSEQGAFVSKEIKGRRYWYFQVQTDSGRSQRYVGPETPDLLHKIENHKRQRSDERERRALVSTLTRSHGLPRPISEIGDIVESLASAGVFRLRGVLVGTVAYQTYSAMLGSRLPGALLQTSDIDIAQFRNVSIAVQDRTPPMLDVLRTVDKTFRVVPRLQKDNRATSYVAKGGLRVDFLTPNEGPDTDEAQDLPALQTDAEPLRFLDFLIHDPERAVLLHNVGVLVNVPAPQRFALHKLVVASRRRIGSGKGRKDLQQASELLKLLAESRPRELKQAWAEAFGRGKKWRQPLLEGLGKITPYSRDVTLRSLDLLRKIIPGMDLTFTSQSASDAPRYDTHRDVVLFMGESLGNRVSCAISREALEDHFGADNLSAKGRLEIFLKHRSKIELMARKKYLTWPVEEPEAVLITTKDAKKL